MGFISLSGLLMWVLLVWAGIVSGFYWFQWVVGVGFIGLG